MMALVKHESQSRDLGEVLVKVKQDLLKLKDKLEVSSLLSLLKGQEQQQQ